MAPQQNHFHPRKRQLEDDTETTSKRVRVEQMFKNLRLSSDEPRQMKVPKNLKSDSFVINPLAASGKLGADEPPKSRIDTYISEKIINSFKNKLHKDFAVGRWFIPIGLIVIHFQRWVKRLFNAFVREYNSMNTGGSRVRPFKTYAKIIQLVQSHTTNINMEHLRQILIEQNIKEQKALRKKYKKKEEQSKVEEINEEITASNESKYTYWDQFRKDAQDMDMEVLLDNGILSSLSDEMILD